MELTSPKVIKELAARHGFTFSKGLGQNFLLDADVLEKIAEAAGDADAVLEIGPGFGVLTKELAESFPSVLSIEIDRRLVPVLEETLEGFSNVEILLGDVMKMDLKALIAERFPGKKVSVAANLPYYITTPILTGLIEKKLPISEIVVMIQKEVAQRICAVAGTKEYGAISVLCQYYTEPEIVATVPAGSFFPPPKVDSAVLRMHVSERPKIESVDEVLFFRIVRAAFSQRRKTLLNCLAHAFGYEKPMLEEVLERAGLPPMIRGEKLGLEEFERITKELKNRNI